MAHRPQLPPPQSTSVSAPFLIPSLQVGAGAAQKPAVQTALATQSPAVAQAFPMAHRPQLPPPQSTSVSAPFLIPSEQVGPGGALLELAVLEPPQAEESAARRSAMGRAVVVREVIMAVSLPERRALW
jgi:hypothetical protein